LQRRFPFQIANYSIISTFCFAVCFADLPLDPLARAPAAAAPQPAASGEAIQVSSPDKPPHLITGEQPEYPPEYVAMKVQGEVLVDFIVLKDGTVAQARAIHSPDLRLSQFAEAAVSKWIFTPGLRDGTPVNCRMRVPVVFEGTSNGPALSFDSKDNSLSDAAKSHLAQGRTFLKAKDYISAGSEFNEAVRLAPDASVVYLARAQAYAKEGREDEALDDFVQAATLDPSNQLALEAYRGTLAHTPEREWASLRYRTFAVVWRTVYETYFDPAFGGLDWLAVREKYRIRLEVAGDDQQLINLLQQMLGELKHTHFAILPREAAVFNPSERTRIGTTGAEVAFVDGHVAVTEVRPGSTAEAAGMRPGDTVSKVDGIDLGSTLTLLARANVNATRGGLYLTQFVESRLGAAVGTKTKLELIAPGQAALPRNVSVECSVNDAKWSDPIGYFPAMPIRCEARRDPDGIAYLRFNIFVPPVMKDARVLLHLLKPGDGLIIDLRGNEGGISEMASGICGWLCRDEFVLGSTHERDGSQDLEVYPQKDPFDGPVAILIDGQSASTSEILAAGLKEHGRARLFGESSAGAALPSIFKSLPTGDLFQFAIGDVTTPSGAMLEGNGVAPNEIILRSTSDLVAGRDPVIKAARDWINGQRRKNR